MLTPEQLTEVVDTMFPLLEGLNTWITQDMVRRYMARLGRGEDAVLTGTDQWQTQVYQEAGGHLEELQRQLRQFSGQTDQEIAAIFEAAAVQAWAADSAVYTAHGLHAEPLALSEHMVRILEDAYSRTQGEVKNFTRTTATASQRRLIRVLDEAHIKVMTGAQSYTSAVQEGLDALVQEQTRVVYPTGHTDTIETAVLRAVRTGVSQATGNMTMQGMIDRDWDLIRVSAHRGARYGDGGHNPGNHFWWQGKLYSRTGRTPGYPLFVESTGYGTGEGLGGWNCRHSFGPGDPDHNPYQEFDAEENKQAFDLSQKQRAMEARIRREKVQLAGYRTAAENAEDGPLRAEQEGKADALAAKLQRHHQQYYKFCEENGLKPLNDRLYTAKRTQAAARTAAYQEPVQPTGNTYQSLHLEPQPVTIQSVGNVKAFQCETLDAAGQAQLVNAHKRLLTTASKQPLGVEVGRAFDLNMQPLTQDIVGPAEGHSVAVPDFDVPYIVIHTHPASGTFSHGDLMNFVQNQNLKLMTAVGHDGHVYAAEKTDGYNMAATNGIVWDLNMKISELQQLPRSELSNEELLERANGLVLEALKQLEENGVKYYG